MTNYPRDLRWKCPHCDIGLMRLPSADRHLRNKHFDCFSCKAERLMVRAIMEGRGRLFVGDMPFMGQRLAERET